MTSASRPVGNARRRRYQFLQALGDAIAYRQSRLAAPCTDCAATPGQRCDDHACDLKLITDYHRAAQATGTALDRARAAEKTRWRISRLLRRRPAAAPAAPEQADHQ